jgi:hypothetical protein
VKYFPLVILFTLFTSDVSACSFAGVKLFRPTLDRWEQHPGPAQLNPDTGGNYWEPVPKPVVKNITITRASYKGGSSCNDSGVISFTVYLPNSSSYELSEFGVYFHVTDGVMPDMIFPDLPLIGIAKGNEMTFVFPWLDQRPSIQKPLNLVVEARLITNGLDLGEAMTFRIEQIDG